ISSDSHIVEPPNLWTDRMDRRFRDRGPRVISEPDGDWWMIDGTRGNSFQGGAQVGKRFERPEELRPAARFSEVRPGAYQPAEFLRENEEDGVCGSVIYPTAGLQLYRVPDLELLSACFRSYNDWLVAFCRTPPGGRRAGLRVGPDEHEIASAPYFLDRLDYTYTQRARRAHWHRYQGDALPSDFFHRNVFLSFQEDAMGIRDRALIGVGLLLWGSDYPHTESTFPRSRIILERILDGVPPEERQQITRSNVAQLYGFAEPS